MDRSYVPPSAVDASTDDGNRNSETDTDCHRALIPTTSSVSSLSTAPEVFENHHSLPTEFTASGESLGIARGEDASNDQGPHMIR